MAARAMLRYQEATDRHAADPGNPIARAQAWASRWHLDYALKKLCNTSLTVRGQEYIGKCPGCGARNVYARIGAEARCYGCEWTGEAKRYLLDQLQTPATVAANN